MGLPRSTRRLWTILRFRLGRPWAIAGGASLIVSIIAGFLGYFRPALAGSLGILVWLVPATVFLATLAAAFVIREKDVVEPPSAQAGRTFALLYTGLPPDAPMVTSFIYPDGQMNIETFRNTTPSEGRWLLKVGTGDYFSEGEYIYRVSATGVTKELKFSVTRRPGRPRPSPPESFVPNGAFPASGPPDMAFSLLFTGLPASEPAKVFIMMPDGTSVDAGRVRAGFDGRLRVKYYSKIRGRHTVSVIHELGSKEISLKIQAPDD